MSNNYSQKITNKDIDLILKYMSSHLVENNSPSIKYVFKTKLYTITIYKTNTILIQGKSFENVLKLINAKAIVKESKVTQSSNTIITIGSDEVGTGDVFGGIIVCGCKIINRDAISKLNIRDSKLIKDSEIKEIFNNIKEYVEYQKYEIYPSDYNKLYNKYQNLNVLKTIGHYQVIKALQKKNTDFALIDQYCSEKKFNEYLKIIDLEKLDNFKMETKAESKYLEVACASIIARYFFVKQINDLSQKANMRLPFGSSNKNIKNIINKIDTKEKCNFIKLHFKNSN
ncbi:MAG: ribonuclease HIII [Malacoplasma sp.]